MAQRQAGYDDKFDFTTVFTDVFRGPAGGDEAPIVLNGPALFNLLEPMGAASFSDAATGRKGEASLADLRPTQRSTVHGLGDCRTLRIDLGNGLWEDLAVGTNDNALFADRRVLLTMSKDNELTWIRDWAQFHARTHGVDAVLLYDNGSSSYRPADVLDALRSVEGIQTAVVVDWDFPYGPQGGDWDGLSAAPWDSDLCQGTSLEHARWRFLHDADTVVHCDIDELLVSREGTLPDELASSAGLVYFTGHWIESMRDGDAESLPGFQDYGWQDERREPTTRKWALSPKRLPDVKQWRTHSVAGAKGAVSENTSQRHFRGITNGWKFDRHDAAPFDPEFHVWDGALAAAMDAAFGTDARDDLEDRRPSTEETLEKRILQEASRLHPEPERLWFKDNSHCLVIFHLGPVRFGFELAITADEVQVWVNGYTEETSEGLAMFVPDDARADDERGWMLGRVERDQSSAEATARNAVAIAESLLRQVVQED